MPGAASAAAAAHEPDLRPHAVLAVGRVVRTLAASALEREVSHAAADARGRRELVARRLPPPLPRAVGGRSEASGARLLARSKVGMRNTAITSAKAHKTTPAPSLRAV